MTSKRHKPDAPKSSGKLHPNLKDLTLDKLKKRIAFAKKRDDGLYEQDGSSRGAEVVWKAIAAYIARPDFDGRTSRKK